MTCDEANVLLHALLDGELDAGHARDIEAHIARCSQCAAQFAAYSAQREALRKLPLYYAAPASLRASIVRRLPAASAPSRRAMLKGFLLGGAASAAAAAGIAVIVVRQDRDSRILGDAVSAHLRSLQAERLTDVVSSDHHTVKPWFNGRLDLAPPVADLSGQGFTLVGGRLDYIDGKPAAVIVYRRRAHVINLFVGQEPGATAPGIETVQGFIILRWRDQGLSLIAVSDLNREELEEFGANFRAASKPGNT